MTGQQRRVQSKEGYFKFTYAFFAIVVFVLKKMCFYGFLFFFFDEVSNFCKLTLRNQNIFI